MAMIEGTHADLQTQRQQLAAALTAGEEENAALKRKSETSIAKYFGLGSCSGSLAAGGTAVYLKSSALAGLTIFGITAVATLAGGTVVLGFYCLYRHRKNKKQNQKDYQSLEVEDQL